MADGHEDGEDAAQGLSLPLARVKRMVKHEVENKAITTEAVFLIAKATELFVEDLASRSGQVMSKAGRKQVSYKDVANAVRGWGEPCEFLQDVVPLPKLGKEVKAAAAAKEKQ